MESVMEQRICVKFCFKVGKTAAETHIMLHEAYNQWTMMMMIWLTLTSRSEPLIAQVKISMEIVD
jgi:hypothetical protein